VQAWVFRQDHRDGRGLPAGVGALVDEVAHRAQVRGVFSQSGGNRGFQRLRAVGVKQRQQPAGEYTKVGAALGRAQEQGPWH